LGVVKSSVTPAAAKTPPAMNPTVETVRKLLYAFTSLDWPGEQCNPSAEQVFESNSDERFELANSPETAPTTRPAPPTPTLTQPSTA